MFCTKCGKEVKGDVKFCPSCGAKVDGPKSQAPMGNQMQGQPVGMNLTNQNMDGIIKIAVTALGLLMVLATILPYLEVFGIEITLLRTDGSQIGDGVIYIILAIFCIAVTWAGKKLPELAGGVVAFLMWLYEGQQMKAVYGQYGDLAKIISKGSGYYLITFTCIALLVVCVGDFVLSHKNKKSAVK